MRGYLFFILPLNLLSNKFYKLLFIVFEDFYCLARKLIVKWINLLKAFSIVHVSAAAGTSSRQLGQLFLDLNDMTMHSLWNSCPPAQGQTEYASPSSKLVWQIVQNMYLPDFTYFWFSSCSSRRNFAINCSSAGGLWVLFKISTMLALANWLHR